MLRLKPSHSNVVACSWHQHRLLILEAKVRGREIEVRHALSVPLDPAATPEQIGQQLAETLHERHVKHFDLLIGLPRSRVEMLSLALPPAADAELPELVQNEVLRQLADLPEDSLVDYYFAQGDSEALRRVEAVAVRPETMLQIRAICEAAGQPATQVVLRPMAIASLFSRLAGHAHNKALLLTVMDCDADMSLFSQGQVIFSRTVRLLDVESDALEATRVSDEIRRTLAVAPFEPHEEDDVGHIFMFDDLKRSNEFIEQLAEELQLPVSMLDPLVGLRVGKEADLQQIHRFPALIGMIRDYAEGTAAVDFVHPKQPPPPPRYGRKIALYSTAALIALALVTGHFKSQLNEAVNEARSLAEDVKKTEEELKRWRSRTAVVDAVGRWKAGEIHWLEELRYLSEQFPAADQAVVRRITMAPTNTGNGVMSMSVRVADPETLDQLEANLRDEFHQVSSKRISQSEGQQDFPYQFETSVLVQPHPVESPPDSEAATDPLLATQR
jgi:Tfp pilus assembly PilM family ATPase